MDSGFKFPLTPSESVLLGLAVGEFERLYKLGEGDTFEDVLYRRVYPFVRDLSQERRIPLEEREISPMLPAIIWYDTDNGIERGMPSRLGPCDVLGLGDEWDLQHAEEQKAFEGARNELDAWLDRVSPDLAVTEFERRPDNKYFYIEVDDSRSSMLDLLMQYLTAGDQVPRLKWNEPHALQRRYHIIENRPKPGRREQGPIEVAKKIERLVDDNEVRRTYEFGRLLGRAAGDCVADEKLLVYMDDSFRQTPEEDREYKEGDLGKEQNLEKTWGSLVESLVKDPVFCECYFDAPGLLRHLRGAKYVFAHGYYGMRPHGLWGWGDGGSPIDVQLAIRTGICVILGYVLGSLRGKDREAELRDAQRPTPRAYTIPHTAAEEMLGGRLLMADQAFNTNDGAKYLPETMVHAIGGAIEASARHAWPDAQGQKLSDLLHEKRRTGSKLESKFANIALPLYTTYRNVAEHAPNTFKCSVHEARHFMTGMRALYELAKQIRGELGGKGKPTLRESP